MTLLTHKLSRVFRNAYLDLRYGAFLGGTVTSPFAALGIHDTANTDYEALPEIFANAIGPSDVLVDVGCGKGRVINWWLSRGFDNQIFGIELDPKIANETSHRLRHYPNVKIIFGDAVLRLPEEGTVFYLFNPFDETWIRALKERMDRFFGSKRPIRVFYYNCLHSEIFEADPCWIVQKINLRHPFHQLAVIQPAAVIDMPGTNDVIRRPSPGKIQ
jgi:hypothetical protein